jgi:nucleotide-binding universal stress UspA family protein
MPHKILCAVDGTSHSDTALKFAAELTGKFGSELTVAFVNVLIGGGRGPIVFAKEENEIEAILASAVKIAKDAGVADVKSVSMRGREAATGIVAYAEEGHFDIVVVGTGDRRGFSRLVLGSVAADVASKAHCTVVVAR